MIDKLCYNIFSLFGSNIYAVASDYSAKRSAQQWVQKNISGDMAPNKAQELLFQIARG